MRATTAAARLAAARLSHYCPQRQRHHCGQTLQPLQLHVTALLLPSSVAALALLWLHRQAQRRPRPLTVLWQVTRQVNRRRR